MSGSCLSQETADRRTHPERRRARDQRPVHGDTDGRQRADLYTLAYSIVRADETVSGAERIYLAQLAALLDLEPSAVERLESEAGAGIDEAAEEKA